MLIEETTDQSICPQPFYNGNVPLLKRIHDNIFWGAAWIAWVFIMAPLFTVMAWYFGYRRFDVYLLHDWPPTSRFLLVFLFILAFSWFVIAIWSIYNWRRFSRRNVRTAPPILGEADLAASLNIALGTLKAGQSAQSGVVYYDESGYMLRIEETNHTQGIKISDEDVS
ncbi:poly-beta-1,6-N-acetyl-D-glucosamine biosynthesis protein PgaD [Acidithiobacillus sp. MC6.1]|nr:poly-beta-1,6-N-acetyl-D-glucosamine biosynthesis protein PgaD [Acidithiobacillus sp. MC6.1]